MNATKKSFQLVDGVYTEKEFGPNCGLEWVDASGNNHRAIVTNLPFDINGEKWSAVVTKYVKLKDGANWLANGNYSIVADENSYRNAQTGEKADKKTAFDSAMKYWDRTVTPAREVDKDFAYETPKVKEGEEPLPPKLKLGFSEEEVFTMKQGFITSGKFFTILFGYNPSGAKASIYEHLYSEIATKEGLII